MSKWAWWTVYVIVLRSVRVGGRGEAGEGAGRLSVIPASNARFFQLSFPLVNSARWAAVSVDHCTDTAACPAVVRGGTAGPESQAGSVCNVVFITVSVADCSVQVCLVCRQCGQDESNSPFLE